MIKVNGEYVDNLQFCLFEDLSGKFTTEMIKNGGPDHLYNAILYETGSFTGVPKGYFEFSLKFFTINSLASSTVFNGILISIASFLIHH